MRILRPLAWIGTAALAATLATVFACSSSPAASGPAQCNTNPWLCDPGQTCWPTACGCAAGATKCDSSNCVAQFTCVAAAAGKQPYDPCRNSPSSVTCGDHQACIEVTAETGRCLPYCDPNDPAHACAANAQCLAYTVGAAPNAPTVHVCVTNTPDGGPQDAARPDVIVPIPDGSFDGQPQPQ